MNTDKLKLFLLEKVNQKLISDTDQEVINEELNKRVYTEVKYTTCESKLRGRIITLYNLLK